MPSDTEITPEWCLNMARLEGDHEIGAGSPDHPLRALTPTASEATAIGAGEVTQADRDAALALLDHNDEHWWNIKTGQGDYHPLVRAFARHRFAATPKVASDTAPSAADVGSVLAWAITGNSPYGTGLLRPVIERLARAALAASPTASDTDTAIPAGEDFGVSRRAAEVRARQPRG